MDIAYTLSDNLVIMSTNLVASMLLVDRHAGISEDQLVCKTTWLYNEITSRNGTLAMNTVPSITTVRNSLNFLKNFVDLKKDVFKPMVKANKDYKNILMLAYYRNNLIHLFINECYIACVLSSFGEIDTQDINVSRVRERTLFLSHLMKDEFMIRNQISTEEDINTTLAFMAGRGYLKFSNEKYLQVTQEGKFAIQFLSSLLLPFVESYWVVLAFIIRLKD